MGDPLPRWQVFSSDAPDGSDTPPGQADHPDRPAVAPRVALLALIGLTVTAGVVALIAVALLVSQIMAEPEGQLAMGDPLSAQPTVATFGLQPTSAVAPDIVVDVAGAVARPGLQRLTPGARVGDAIEAAGGFASRVDLTAASVELNLAQALEDGAKVFVPSLDTTSTSKAQAGEASSLIDLNRADQAALESLPGIGPVTAGRIIEARAERRFAQVEDLRTRGLVGASVFSDIESLVQVH